jgi:hypothetical protein
MRKAGNVARDAEGKDRERRKRLWFDPVIADLGTDEALEQAAEFHVSRRTVADVVGRIVNLNSFLDAGYVYVSNAGLARLIKNPNGASMSKRQIQRVIVFLRARGHLRLEHRQGAQNWIFPLYRAVDTSDIVSMDPGHYVHGPMTSCPPKLITKLNIQTRSPQSPSYDQNQTVVQLDDRSGQASKKLIEGAEIIQRRVAQRLGEGNVEAGFLIFLELSDGRRDQLTAMERVGKLTDIELASARTAVGARRHALT